MTGAPTSQHPSVAYLSAERSPLQYMLAGTAIGIAGVMGGAYWIKKTATTAGELALPGAAIALVCIGFAIALVTSIAGGITAARRRVDGRIDPVRMWGTFALGGLFVVLTAVSLGVGIALF
ncbi:hypothetical protein [Microbacterium oryzae]|nr:hypothetical protein [Microbacterium oryzae]